MAYYPDITAQLDSYEKGVIDMEVGTFFTPFSKVYGLIEEEEERLTKKVNDDIQKEGRSILFSVVFLVLGFILAFSYRTLGINQETDSTESPHLTRKRIIEKD